MENLLFLGDPILKHIRVLHLKKKKENIYEMEKWNWYYFRGSKYAIFIIISLKKGVNFLLGASSSLC